MTHRRGSALVIALGAAVILTTLGLAMVSRSVHDARIVEIDRSYYQALYAAEAGAETARKDILDAFSEVFAGGQQLTLTFGWLDDLETGAEDPPYDRSALTGYVGGASYSVAITRVENPSAPSETGVRYVTIRSTGTAGGVSRIIEVTFRIGLAPSRVFDYSYFVNNFGWFYGGGITSNGDIRSNGDFAFQGNPVVNGDVYAATNPDLSAPGDIYGNHRNKTVEWYRNHVSDRARPTDPTADPEDANGNGELDPGEDRNDNGILDDFEYPAGYDGQSEDFAHQEVLNMPYLGDLSLYRALALSEGGKIVQDGQVIVDAVYDGAGPDGRDGTADDGCLVLVGTEEHPIEVDGPVVIDKDLVIRGVVKGQGTIYTGRNVHIVGDLTYADPPSWPKPDENPEQTAAANANKDLLGLMAKGNVVLGDYTSQSWYSVTHRYLKPPFTQGYEVDASDAAIGYDSDGYAGNGYWFDGNYLNWDGGFKNRDAEGHHQEPRAYYESSVDDGTVHAIASNQIREVSAVMFTNHAFTGRVGRFALNGSLIARDEAVIYSGSIELNYDVRARGDSLEFIDFYLARDLAEPEVLAWREIQ